MKKIFFLLLCLITICSYAQEQPIDSVIFAWDKPSTLNPKIDTIKTTYTSRDITGLTFKNRNINIELYRDGNYGACVLSSLDLPKSFLTVYSCGRLNINSSVDELVEIRFGGTNTLVLNETGHKMSYSHNVWKKDDTYTQPVHQVLFRGNSSYAYIDTIVVKYRVKQDVITPVSTSIAEGASIKNFDGVSFTFDQAKDIELVEGAKIVVVGPTSEDEIELTANTKEQILELAAAKSLEPGSYTIIIPEHSLKCSVSEDYDLYNPEIKLNFTVAEPFDIFEITQLTPAPGEKIESIPVTIVADFAGGVGGIDSSKEIELYKDGDEVPYCTFTATQSGNTKVNFTTKFPVTDEGIYTLIIPEGTVFDGNYTKNKDKSKFNPLYEYKFYVGVEPPAGDDDEGDEDDKDKKDPVASADTLAMANTLLEYSGAGYPAKDSEARLAIVKLLEDYQSTNAQYDEAFKNFYASKEIELPADTTYRIANISGKDGSKLYLTYDDVKHAIDFSDKVEDACIFDAKTAEDGKTLFITKDGYYLHTLVDTDNYEGTSKANVTKDSTSICSITIEKFASEEVDAKDVFGYVTLFGEIGTKDDVSKSAYSRVNTDTKEADLDADGGIYFNEKKSSVFVIEAKSRPYVPYNTTIVTDPVHNARVNYLDYVKVSFPDVTEEVVYTANPVVYLMQGTDSIAPLSVVPTEGATNQFKINFRDLERGYYQLYMPMGAFMCGNDTIQAYQMDINIINGYGFQADMNSMLVINGNISRPNMCISEEVNHLSLYDKDWTKLPNISKDAKVQLHPARTSDWETNILATGNLVAGEAYDDPRLITDPQTGEDVWYTDTVSVLDIKFDKTFKDNDLRPTIESDDTYMLVIFEGSFGDDNYAKYIAGDTSIRKEECHINENYRLTFTVRRTEAVDIISVSDENEKNDVIYDLTGRRVNDAKGGIYIVNGKKKYIK